MKAPVNFYGDKSPFVLRTLKYCVAAFGLSITYAAALNLFAIPHLRAGRPPVSWVAIVVWSPLIESAVLMCVGQIFVNRSQSGLLWARALSFIGCISSLAWLAHGANVNALIPAILFGVSALYIWRSLTVYDHAPAITYCGAVLIHSMFNLPSVFR